MGLRSLTERIHVSWLIVAWCLGVVIGIIAAGQAEYGFFAHSVWLVASALLAGFMFIGRRWVIGIMIIAGLLFGLWRGGAGQIGLEKYQLLIGREVQISGKILEDPDIDKRGNSLLRLGDVMINGQQLPGVVWVSTERSDALKRSDVAAVRGKLSKGFGAFAASMYRAKIERVERPVPGDVAVGVRDWFAQRVRQYLPEAESALGLGFLTGLRRALPPELLDALKIAGLTHVIVASGYNLTILVRLARRLFVKHSKYLATISAVAMILGFMALTGLSPSMSRAGLVAGLSLAAWYCGRKIHSFVLLPVAAAVTLMINPQFGWNDLGWQLSFASFAGVIILAPLLQRYFFGEKEPGTLRQIIGETFAAQLMTLPILLLAFGVMSNVALLANILILPLVPLAMLLVFLVGIFAAIPLLAGLIATPAQWLLSYMIETARYLSNFSWSQTEVPISWWQMVLMYMALFLAMWWMQRQTKLKLREVNIVE